MSLFLVQVAHLYEWTGGAKKCHSCDSFWTWRAQSMRICLVLTALGSVPAPAHIRPANCLRGGFLEVFRLTRYTRLFPKFARKFSADRLLATCHREANGEEC